MPPKKKVTAKKLAISLADEILNGSDEQIPVIETIQPEVAPEAVPIPVVKTEPYQDKKQTGVRFFDPQLAGKTPHGSVGHDLLWSAKFDEKGISEVVTEPKVIEKLLRMNWKVYKA